MFRALLCSSSGGQLYEHSTWYRHTLWVTVQYTGYLCTEQSPKESDDTRYCVNTWLFSTQVTCVLNSHPKRVTIPDTVLIRDCSVHRLPAY